MEAYGNRMEEEKLREAACTGDEESIKILLTNRVNVNSQNEINGWTPLHWAAKRGHTQAVNYLMLNGADPAIASKSGETASMVTDNIEIKTMLGSPSCRVSPEKLPIIPHYLAYPTLNAKVEPSVQSKSAVTLPHQPTAVPGELVLKVRTANLEDPDFIEVELSTHQLTYSNLLNTCCRELQLDPYKVVKVRKLPDTIIRKDKDVKRLHNFQEIELCADAPSLTKKLLDKSHMCKNGTILY